MDQTVKPGDANRITREYLDSLLIEMRLIDSVLPDTSLTLYGESFATPVMTAALSHLNSTHPGGMAELARGAKLAGAVMWAGMGPEEELEEIIETGARTIKIIKPYADTDLIYKKIAHAESVGCLAVGMDIDHAFNRKGEYDTVFGQPMSGKTFEEICRFVKATKLPFIIKGVLSVQDALKCADAGVQGIVVSHHHGTLDYAVPPLMILPEIVQAVGGRFPIFVDCSIDSGLDVFKAIALGAAAASVGRAVMGPLAENGAQGAARKITEMTQQLAWAMTRTCSPCLERIDSAVIRRA